jgi:processing peptidase subunit alpha
MTRRAISARPYLVATPAALAHPNGDSLAGLMAENYTAPRVVLAASGCSHADLVAVTERLLSQLKAEPGPGALRSAYVGGDYRVTTDSPVTNIVMAFEFQGGWHNTKAATAVTVLNTLLGGGGSFSAGGPGKGMYCEGGSTAITAKTLPSGTAAVVHCVRGFTAL